MPTADLHVLITEDGRIEQITVKNRDEQDNVSNEDKTSDSDSDSDNGCENDKTIDNSSDTGETVVQKQEHLPPKGAKLKAKMERGEIKVHESRRNDGSRQLSALVNYVQRQCKLETGENGDWTPAAGEMLKELLAKAKKGRARSSDQQEESPAKKMNTNDKKQIKEETNSPSEVKQDEDTVTVNQLQYWTKANLLKELEGVLLQENLRQHFWAHALLNQLKTNESSS